MTTPIRADERAIDDDPVRGNRGEFRRLMAHYVQCQKKLFVWQVFAIASWTGWIVHEVMR